LNNSVCITELLRLIRLVNRLDGRNGNLIVMLYVAISPHSTIIVAGEMIFWRNC
jgi:hypothetical protein